MKCRYCENDSENVVGYWFDDGGSMKEEGDFVCSECFEDRVK